MHGGGTVCFITVFHESRHHLPAFPPIIKWATKIIHGLVLDLSGVKWVGIHRRRVLLQSKKIMGTGGGEKMFRVGDDETCSFLGIINSGVLQPRSAARLEKLDQGCGPQLANGTDHFLLRCKPVLPPACHEHII